MIADGVTLGRIPLRRECVSHATIDLCAELPGRGRRCYALPMLDVVPPDPGRLLAAALPSVVATWLAMTGRAGSVDEAVERVRAVRPRIVLGDEAKQAIAEADERAQ